MTTIHLDITRLFVRGSRSAPTGIDRVVLAYADWLLKDSGLNAQPMLTVGGRLWRLRRETLADIVRSAGLFEPASAAGASPTFKQLIDSMRADGREMNPLRPPPSRQQLPARALWYAHVAVRSLLGLAPLSLKAGDIYLNVSHTGLGDPHTLQRVTMCGAKAIIMLHDLIPLTHPEYCSPEAKPRHYRRMIQISEHASHVICNSLTTSRDFDRWSQSEKRRIPPKDVIPLGLHSAFLRPPVAIETSVPYFIYVGTLEARKNIAFLLAIWRRLEEIMLERTPRLILVGRRGWENEAVIDHLERSSTALRLISEVSDLPDEDVAQLIAGASALLSPSFAEGFDLPVHEALALRTPVIASDIPVHREFASTATLVDPLDGPGWLHAIMAATIERARGPSAPLPTWSAHFVRFEEILLDVANVGGSG